MTNYIIFDNGKYKYVAAFGTTPEDWKKAEAYKIERKNVLGDGVLIEMSAKEHRDYDNKLLLETLRSDAYRKELFRESCANAALLYP